MQTTDETILLEGQTNKQPTNKHNAPSWQSVSIGGAMGIAMGVAGTYAAEAFAAEDVANAPDEDSAAQETSATATVTEVHQAAVDQNLSFADAFAAAREEVGAGGVFLWHGQLYNTYTADEWQGMSDAQKDEFAADVQPYLSQQTPQNHHTAHHTETHHTETPHTPGYVHQRGQTEEVTNEPEVHFLGVETREIEGQTVNVGHMTIDDISVALVDVDNDQVFDVRLMDRNSNGELEDNEITDISGHGLTVEDFQMVSALEEATGGQLEQAMTQQEDLAPDMPDYMNDADVDIV